MKAFVVGICGFIGSHLACRLYDEGLEVFGLDFSSKTRNERLAKLIESGEVKVVQGDLTSYDFGALGAADYVYQVAGKVSAWGDIRDFDRVNVDGTRRVIDYAKSVSAKCFLYLSSVAVYGYRGYVDLPEEAEKIPMDNPYSLSKLKAETMVMSYCRDIGQNYVVIRPGNVYGEYDMTSSYDIYRLVKKGQMPVVDQGSHKSCFVYGGNLADGICRASLTPSAYNEDYNLTDGAGETLKEYLTHVANAFGVNPKFMSLPAPLAKLAAYFVEGVFKLIRSETMPKITLFSVLQNSVDYHFSIEKARRAFGYSPAVSQEEGTARTAAWFNTMPQNIKVKRK
ncbi:MAG TPA: NAD(P)-dependent oxidoreductase [Eubacteriales bacterium]|jgi:nucleoside-diphosphate-sugar epimerase|nr:NAD(P)-dependent oxidoreductase [Clostridia bacterium]HRR89560.1 NAD(P)-dependent oxidoreductase [Eubacteriales bacterium]HRU84325.1 NAD(P)-dependent oxidoreductase [Eubacteriales bacterium]